MQAFAERFALTPSTRVLDVGGTPSNWNLLAHRPRLTILNEARTAAEQGTLTWVAGDGCRLPFRDQAFDIVFSNSVIEHVGSPERQHAFAREIARVGRRYFVETPDPRFPIEPHLLTPFLHWLPRRWRRMAHHVNGWALLTRPSPDRRAFYVRHVVDDVALLSLSRLAELFPEPRIESERFLGWPKSLLAVKSQ